MIYELIITGVCEKTTDGQSAFPSGDRTEGRDYSGCLMLGVEEVCLHNSNYINVMKTNIEPAVYTEQ